MVFISAFGAAVDVNSLASRFLRCLRLKMDRLSIARGTLIYGLADISRRVVLAWLAHRDIIAAHEKPCREIGGWGERH